MNMASKTTCPISREDFLAKAQPVKIELNGFPLIAEPREFSTGSFGWNVNSKATIQVDKKAITAIVHREVRDMPGVVELGGLSIWKRIARWLGLGLGPRGIRVDLGEGEIGVVITLVVKHGVDIPELARSLRLRISDAV